MSVQAMVGTDYKSQTASYVVEDVVFDDDAGVLVVQHDSSHRRTGPET